MENKKPSKTIGEMLVEDKKHIRTGNPENKGESSDDVIMDSGLQKQKIGLLKEKEPTQEEINIQLQYAYSFIIDELKYYLDLKEEYYNLIALWIIGTYSHHEFPSYPYLFFNAMRGSGKTRLMKLIVSIAKDGDMLNSLTEAVLFRENGTLCIDEFEGLGRKGTENLKELLNSAYKKGTKVKRMAKRKVLGNEEQVVDKFDVYRPICMANIYGLVDEALKDRCITLILEKSNDNTKTNLIEMFDTDENVINAKNILKKCSKCSVDALFKTYKAWNSFLKGNYTTTLSSLTTLTTLFNTIKDTNLNGREIELCFPLLLISERVGTLEETAKTLKDIFHERKEEELNENMDISIYDFFSQEIETQNIVSIKELVKRFKEYLGREDEFINERWFSRRLTTLKLYKEKKRRNQGMYILPDYQKAREKMEMFR